MNRSTVAALVLALLTSAMPGQSRLETVQLIGDLPLTLKNDYAGRGSSYLYSTPDGHELQIQCRKDSSVYAFVAHPSKKVTSEADRRAFVKAVMTNAFGVDTSLTNWFDHVGTSLTPNGDAVRHFNRNEWSLSLMIDNKAISRLLVRVRSANKL